jgi:hypothetical protein
MLSGEDHSLKSGTRIRIETPAALSTLAYYVKIP